MLDCPPSLACPPSPLKPHRLDKVQIELGPLLGLGLADAAHGKQHAEDERAAALLLALDRDLADLVDIDGVQPINVLSGRLLAAAAPVVVEPAGLVPGLLHTFELVNEQAPENVGVAWV